MIRSGSSSPSSNRRVVPAADDFLHGGEVVRPLDRADDEVPVVLLRRFPVAEDHAGGHRVGALDVGVVEAFDVARFDRQSQVGFHRLHDPVGMRLRIDDALLVHPFHACHPGVLFGEFHQMSFVRFGRHAQFDPFAQRNVQRKGDQDLAGIRGKHPADLHDGQREQFLVRFVHPFVDLHRIGLDHCSAHHPQIVHVGILAVRDDAEDIHVVDRRARPRSNGPGSFPSGGSFLSPSEPARKPGRGRRHSSAGAGQRVLRRNVPG